ncbi:hypothetical protein [Mesorhizobium sp.]|uniref:nSTAND1 domain-containing NTPase n=1 Tax=Mesorhizobium sp. TaxID=1871066 RepID=UPI0033901090
MRDAGAERALVVLGASGAGKSSFLRAGLWPRLRRMTFASRIPPTFAAARTTGSGVVSVIQRCTAS